MLVTFCAGAQDFHINLFAGAANYQGDLQDKRFTLAQSHFAGGVGVSYDVTDKISVRSGITVGMVSGDDKKGRNMNRNLNFTSNLFEFSLGGEYYITRIEDHVLTPYVFAGVAVYHFDPYTFDTTGKKFFLQPLSTEGEGFLQGVKNYKLTQFAIPFGAGVKFSLSETINVGAEIGLRRLFTDYLDDVSTTYVDQALLFANRGPKAVDLAFRGDELKSGLTYPAAGKIRGGAKIKDWYYFAGFTASFTVGRGSLGRHSQYGCPANVY